MSDSKQSDTHKEPQDDGWHYLSSRDEKHEEYYIEWKYFNFIQKDLAGYIIYYLLDPEKKSSLGGGRLLVRILKDGKAYGLVKKIDMDKVELDQVSASIVMDTARIIEKDPFHYELDCQSPDMSWNLNYRQEAPTIESYQKTRAGLMRWEKISWLVKMPKAKVEGVVSIGKETFHINGFGYSDTNWGEMLPFFLKYEWGQYNDESMSLVFGIIYNLDTIKSTYFYLVLGEHVIKIENEKCEVEHTEWLEDKEVGLKIPSKSSFKVKDSEYEINFTTKLLDHDSPGIKVHPLLPKVIVSEQIVEYDGVVLKNGEVLCKFKGKGFQEWPGKTWKEVEVAF